MKETLKQTTFMCLLGGVIFCRMFSELVAPIQLDVFLSKYY